MAEFEFEKELKRLINRHSMEKSSNTPDFILAKYMKQCLIAFSVACNERDSFHGHDSYILDQQHKGQANECE